MPARRVVFSRKRVRARAIDPLGRAVGSATDAIAGFSTSSIAD